MKNFTKLVGDFYPQIKKLTLIMRLSVLFILITVFSSTASVYSQATRLTVKMENARLSEVFDAIEKQSEFYFFYNRDYFNDDRIVSIDVEKKLVDEVLKELFQGEAITWEIFNRNILLRIPEAPLTTAQQEVMQQQKTVSGKVTDSSGSPLPGVSVVVKGTTTGTVTSPDGTFTLSIPQNAETLQFSFVGMRSQEIPIEGRGTFTVVMKEETVGLEEVIAIGYGTMRRSDLTGAIAEVNQKYLKDMPTTTIDQKLVGQVSGVQVQQLSGVPGGGTSIKIRGSGSIGAGNEPLYVVDGMPYSSSIGQALNPLAYINPNDIKSISILKDASSTAIYGSRGANGVIMITTKRGNYSQTDISVSVVTGFQQVPQKGRPDMMNQYDAAELQREKIAKMIMKRENRIATDRDYPSVILPENLVGEGTDWYDLILQNAFTQDYNISVNKGGNDSRLNFSLGYFNQEGVLRFTGFERFSGKLTMESNIGNSIKIGGSLQPTFISQDRTSTNQNRLDVIGYATWAHPFMVPYDENGELLPYIDVPKTKYHTPWSFPNPLFILQETIQEQNNFRNLGIAFIEWEVIPGLIAKSSLNTIFSARKYFQFVPGTIGGTNSPPKGGTGYSVNQRGDSFNWLLENTLSYSKTYKKHSFSILAGYTAQHNKDEDVNLRADPYSNDLIQTINAAQAIKAWGQSFGEWAMISYLGRLNYSFDDRYLFTATFRSDGSSRFGDKKRYAFFPSIAGAWRVSEESFLANHKTIDNLKLRLTYGRSGNNNIGNYAHLASIGAGSYIFGSNQVTASSIGISNPYLTWEESEQIDAGIDLGLFNNRLSFVIDYYNRKSVNMLLNDIIPAITGFNSQTVNKGNIRNSGVEFSLLANPINKKFNWETNFNLSVNRNKVISLNNNNDPLYAGDVDNHPTHITVVGKPIGQFFGYLFDGLFTKEEITNPEVPKDPSAPLYEGAIRYKDLDGDKILNDILDYTILGNPHPDFTYGFTNSFSYNNFDLSIIVNGQYGGKVINALRQTTDNIQGFFNVSKEWTNRYRNKDNPGDGKHYGVPDGTPSRGHRFSDLWIEDATYLRISNLTFGYSLPANLVKRSGFISNCRFYLTVQNLAMFTKYSGANPEAQSINYSNVLAPGFDMTSYPLSRTASLGFNLTF